MEICNFFVVSGNRQVLLGMPDTEILNILTINCNTVDTKETDRTARWNAGCEEHHTNIRQEAGKVLYKHKQ